MSVYTILLIIVIIMKEFIKQNKALKGVIRETAEIAGYLWQRGWAERNAGNISVNITDLMLPEFPVVDSSACILVSFRIMLIVRI